MYVFNAPKKALTSVVYRIYVSFSFNVYISNWVCLWYAHPPSGLHKTIFDRGLMLDSLCYANHNRIVQREIKSSAPYC